MVGAPPQHAPMLVLGFLRIDSSILAGILVHLMHLEIHSSNKQNLAVEGLLPSLLVVPMPMFLQLTFLFLISSPFFPIFSTRQSILRLANNFSLWSGREISISEIVNPFFSSPPI